jgi:branched-subunit amino acid aminotransferase/4-amino-4-deoxychorismate lyase
VSERDALARDGVLVADPDSGQIRCADPAFLYGEGSFETLRTYEGRAFAVGDHHARLSGGGEARSGTSPDASVPARAAVQRAIEVVLAERRRRVGDGCESLVRLIWAKTSDGRSLLCHATDLPPPPTALRARGARLRSRGPLLGAGAVGLGIAPKSLAYALRRAALQWALDEGADEIACFSESGYLQSGATCNLALVLGGRLIAPPADATHVRDGVTLARLLSCANSLGFSAERRPVHRDEFRAAEAALLCSSLREIVPVVALDDQAIGAGVWSVEPWVAALRGSRSPTGTE